ncbi:MAG: glycoside hydrolase family 3 C-terminal domain-containing protein [Clostridia bacterium]|nr:glycoside hydrolase family 3 C-terminal domain-containing protein [Clostridia bacterium]
MDLNALLQSMTMKEKIGQLTQCTAELFLQTDAAATGPREAIGLPKEMLPLVGSVLNFANAEEMCAIQRAHLEADRLKIPMLFMMDVIHGYRTIFPIPLAMGCSMDPSLMDDCSQMAAKEAAASGVHVTFTPMADQCRDARWGRIMETTGEDPLLNEWMGKAQVWGFQGTTRDNTDLRSPDTLAACVKHFAGYGAVEAGRDYNTVELSERTLRETHFPAYKACIDAGARMVMTSFSAVDGLPAVANPWLMKTVLKEEMGFDGVVISDYDAIRELTVHGVAADLKEAARLAFSNGCDIEMCSAAYALHLEALVNDGVLSEADIDNAVMRVLRLKEELGLFDDPYRAVDPQREDAVCTDPAHRVLAREAAEKTAVLLKNNGILPFSKEVKRVALIGPFAENHAILGFWSCRGREEESVTVRQGVEALLPYAEVTAVRGCGNTVGDVDRSGFDEAVKAASEADVVILCLGEPSHYSGEGNSRVDIALPGVQEALAEAVIEANPQTAVVLFNGRPLAVPRLKETAPAILEMWFPGSEGGSAAARLLFGEVNPSAKLAVTVPRCVGQCPISYRYASTGRPKTIAHGYQPFRSNYLDEEITPLWPFGYGLSYSRFVYESLRLETDTLRCGERLMVTLVLRNDSDREGTETVQAYIRDLHASVTRPTQQLMWFSKVTLPPHQRITLKIPVEESDLCFFDREMRYVAEAGTFELFVGYADHPVHAVQFRLE